MGWGRGNQIQPYVELFSRFQFFFSSDIIIAQDTYFLAFKKSVIRCDVKPFCKFSQNFKNKYTNLFSYLILK